MSSASRHYDDRDREPVIPYCLGLGFVATGARTDRVLFRNIAGQIREDVTASAPGASAYLQFIYREFGLVLSAYTRGQRVTG